MINLIGKVVYSTKTAGASAGTMFDAFIHTMSKPHIAKQSAQKIVADTQKVAGYRKRTANELLRKSGIDADVSCRVKGVDSTAAKQIRYLKDYDTYENKREQIQDIILGKGMGEIIGDSYGIRYTIKSGNPENLHNAIVNKSKSRADFFVKSIEDYHGANITPYANKNVLDKYANLTYRDIRGIQRQTTSTSALKNSGYTRDNINATINGTNAEIQIGGKFTNPWGDVEHYLYDIRMGKPLDLSKLTPEQKKIAISLQREYTKLLQDKKANQYFTQNYLNKIWEYLRNSETKGLATPELPPFPAGYNDVLRAENILKLAHV